MSAIITVALTACMRVAVCRCLRLRFLSFMSHESIIGLYGSSFDPHSFLAGSSGDMSPIFLCLHAVGSDIPLVLGYLRDGIAVGAALLD